MKKLLIALTAFSFLTTAVYSVVAEAAQKKQEAKAKVAKKASKSAKAKAKAKK